MNRAERRQAVKDQRANKWAHLARNFRTLSGNELVSLEDRRALRDAARRLDRGDRPLVVLSRIRATLARIDAMTKNGS